MKQIGPFWMAAIVPLVCLLAWQSPARTPQERPEPAPGGTRGPSCIAFSREGALVYVAEQEAASIAVLDAATGETLATIPSGGKEPTGIALSDRENTLFVANSFTGTVGIIDLDKRILRTTIPVPGGPYSIVAAGGRAFVSVGSMNVVDVIDPGAGKVISSIPVGRRPRALAVTPDGATIVCGNMASGDLSIINVRDARETARIPIGAINLRGVAISSDGARAYVTAQQPHNDLPTDKPEAMWSNVLCVVNLMAPARLNQTIALDGPMQGAADPYGVLIGGDTAYVTLGGMHMLEKVSLDTKAPAATVRTLVGANPRAIARRPGGELWIANYLGNSLSVRDAGGNPLRTITLDPPGLTNPRLLGQYLFASAHLTKGERFTCNTCHPDGNTEGLAWKFAHVKDGLELRNSRNLRGGLLLTGPYGWTARHNDFEEFVSDEVQHLLGGPKLPHSQIHGLWDMVNEFDMPPNPYRTVEGTFTASGLRGKALFEGVAGCSACHAGGMVGGVGKKVWIGTTPVGVLLDVPHLVGAYDSPPYLHDARAATLEDIFTKYDEKHLHGNTGALTAAQFHDLIEYVREL